MMGGVCRGGALCMLNERYYTFFSLSMQGLVRFNVIYFFNLKSTVFNFFFGIVFICRFLLLNIDIATNVEEQKFPVG